MQLLQLLILLLLKNVYYYIITSLWYDMNVGYMSRRQQPNDTKKQNTTLRGRGVPDREILRP